MANFPVLKTKAVAQYPLRRVVQFQNQTLRFLDGTEQRYRDSAGPLRRWDIQLDQLDETEAAAVDEFFLSNQGAFGTFAFTDPWDGRVYESCSIAGDELPLSSAGEMQGRTVLTVMENRCSSTRN
jgi:Conserved hypothetical protein 2217 (DUF2460)